MKLPFRQGIVRYQRDPAGAPMFLLRSTGGSAIDLNVAPDPTVVTFAHGKFDYLHEERTSVEDAWDGFTSGTDYWLYIDISLINGERTFGQTEVEPIYGLTQPSPPVAQDQHWFDTRSKKMKVWNGVTFVDHVRVFLGKYDEGAVIQAEPTGSPAHLNETIYAGHILYDDDDIPVRKFDRRGRGAFFTTETVFTTHSAKSVNVKIESLVETSVSSESIPAYSLVSNLPDGRIRLANTDSVVAGLVEEDLLNGEMGQVSTSGYIESDVWNWTDDPGTALYCDDNGNLTTTVPQAGIIHKVGEVVSAHKIFMKLEQSIILDES